MSSEVDFVQKYDELLDIKSKFGPNAYKREIVKPQFNCVGFEIELAIEYQRDRYTFIKTLLSNIKKIVGENGYFTKDGTILGDYNLEIVLDPLPIKNAVNIYRKIMQIVDFSDGSICFDTKHQCGLHLNFNQFDIKDIAVAHQRLLWLVKNKSEYFEENIYKRTWEYYNFNEYLEFQKSIASKYVGINYLDKKLVEIRNVKVGLTHKQLGAIAVEILIALFQEHLVETEDFEFEKKPDEFPNSEELFSLDDFLETANTPVEEILMKRSQLLNKFMTEIQSKYENILNTICIALNKDGKMLTEVQRKTLLNSLDYYSKIEEIEAENRMIKKLLYGGVLEEEIKNRK